MLTAKNMQARRTRRVRADLRRKSKDRPRLSVFRSSKHIYAQVIMALLLLAFILRKEGKKK